MHHNEPECMQKDLFAIFKDKVVASAYKSVYTISTELILLQSNLIWWYIVIRWSVLCNNWIVVLNSRFK